MRFRTFPHSSLQVSAVGFGLWTVSTGWWGEYTDAQAVALMQEALDLGINLFDAADTYGNGRSEELIWKAFGEGGRRDRIVIATKVGYDVLNHGNDARRGQQAIPHDFSPAGIRAATEASLRRLRTDRIDLLQLHNVGMAEADRDELWDTLAALEREGKVLRSGFALGPAIGWLHEGLRRIERRNPAVVQHIFNLLEQHPGAALHEAARAGGKDTMFLVRVPHSSGMLEGRYTADTVFPPNDHRRHRPKSWLMNGVQKVGNLRFLEGPGRTLGQAAIQWLLADDRTASVLPNIYDSAQLREFAAAPDSPALAPDEMVRLRELHAENFGAPAEEHRFKGTMTAEEAAAWDREHEPAAA